jgi:HD superfamily phosphodiesterase
MDLTNQIDSSEKKYKEKLEDFISEIFIKLKLISHGSDHHMRVWTYAKKILYHLNRQGFDFAESFTDKLIIACYLHDSGMSIDPGFNHGKQSRIICAQFLLKYNLSSAKFNALLDTIEYHDNKEYKVPGRLDDLLTILSAADDLDAFGFIGIYRYIEIYLTRNEPLKELGNLIKENAGRRYKHFLRNYGSDETLINEHRKRYDIVDSFFIEYNNQVIDYIFDNHEPAGYCGVAEYIHTLLHNNLIPEGMNSLSLIKHPDPVIQWFFKGLRKELSGF